MFSGMEELMKILNAGETPCVGGCPSSPSPYRIYGRLKYLPMGSYGPMGLFDSVHPSTKTKKLPLIPFPGIKQMVKDFSKEIQDM